MIEDTKLFLKAAEKSSNKYHNEKLDEVNKILFDIWQEVYHGGDIEFIKIQPVPQKKGGYGYTIMMSKKG